MRSQSVQIGIRRRRVAALTACLVAGWLMLPVPFGMAQEAAPQPAPQAAPQAAPAQKPGVFESIGRWFDQGATNFRDSFRGAKRRWDDLGSEAAANNKDFTDKAEEARKNAAEATKSAVDATKNAVDAVAKLPAARVVQGREKCQTAPNGAPDCLAAAEALCRKQGYATGKSMDFTSAEECPAKTLIGQASREECVTTTFISRAMCQ
jgi:hypothetical protein